MEILMVTRPTSTQDALLNRKGWFVVLVVILAVLREEPYIEEFWSMIMLPVQYDKTFLKSILNPSEEY